MEYISLGSNCSLTYQLNKFKLRTQAYPFDWTKISLQQLIDVLENNFENYSESIKFKKISLSHPIIDSDNNLELNSSSIVVSNKYKISFAHEITSQYELEEFKNRINARIKRLDELSLNHSTNFIKIKFIRIELSPINSSWAQKILKLIYLLDNNFVQYELILIINSSDNFEFPSNVKIYRFDNFSSDWKMDSLDWNLILELR